MTIYEHNGFHLHSVRPSIHFTFQLCIAKGQLGLKKGDVCTQVTVRDDLPENGALLGVKLLRGKLAYKPGSAIWEQLTLFHKGQSCQKNAGLG